MIGRLLCTAFACVAFSTTGSTQGWPSKPITFIVPAAAGSGVDVPTRLYTERIAQKLGQAVIVSNRPGASGAIAARAAAQAAPDGYTFFVATAGTQFVNKYTMKAPGYDPEKDFVAVALLNRAPFMLLVNPALPVNSVAELGTYSKANSGKVFLAYEGSPVQALASYTTRTLGLPIDLVGFNSPIQAIQETISGSTQVHIQGTAIGLAFVNDKKLRPLAMIADKRLPQLPSVPTMNELHPGFGTFDAWIAVTAPTGTPPEIIKRLSAELHGIASQADMQAIFNKLGFLEESDRSPETTASYFRNQADQFAKMAVVADLKPE